MHEVQGFREGVSDSFYGSNVGNLTLDLCKKLSPQLEHVTTKLHGSNLIVAPRLALYYSNKKLNFNTR